MVTILCYNMTKATALTMAFIAAPPIFYREIGNSYW